MRGTAGRSRTSRSVSRWARASVVPCTGWGRFPSRGRGRAAGSRSCSRRGRRRWRACQKNQETPPRHPAHHRTWLLQRQARGVQQQDQGHHPHGLRLPPRHQPHRPDHAPMQRTRHPTTTTHNLTHKKQQKPLKYPTFRPHPPQGSNQALQKARHRFREESAARFHKGTQSQDHTHRSIPISTRT